MSGVMPTRGLGILFYNHTPVYKDEDLEQAESNSAYVSLRDIDDLEDDADERKAPCKDSGEGREMIGWKRTGLNKGARFSVETGKSAYRNPVKTAAIVALLGLLGVIIAKALGHEVPFDTLKKLVLDHKLPSAIVAGGIGLGVLGYGYGRHEAGADLLAEARQYFPFTSKNDRKAYSFVVEGGYGSDVDTIRKRANSNESTLSKESTWSGNLLVSDDDNDDS